MHIIIIIVLAISLFFNQSIGVDELANIEIAIEVEEIGIYTPDNLTNDMLRERDGKLMVEILIGKVLNNELDGQILNTTYSQNYISYSRVENAQVGNIVLTILIYNPETNYTDDIKYRFDYIIK